MECSGDAFHTFLDIDSAIYLAVSGTVTSLPVFIQNILNCVPRMNETFMGSEQHGGKWKITIFSFWVEYPFNPMKQKLALDANENCPRIMQSSAWVLGTLLNHYVYILIDIYID